MYNRYMNSGGFEEYFRPVQDNPPRPQTAPPPQQQNRDDGRENPITKGINSLKGLLGGNKEGAGGLKLPEINADTMLLLVLVYFLINDKDSENSNMSETLLIIGALLLLGL